MFIAFDVLQVGAHDIRQLPLAKRRSILEDAIDGSEMVLPVRRLEPHGSRLEDRRTARARGFVAKDPASVYRSGTTRSRTKVKVGHESVFVVGGFRNPDAFAAVPSAEPETPEDAGWHRRIRLSYPRNALSRC